MTEENGDVPSALVALIRTKMRTPGFSRGIVRVFMPKAGAATAVQVWLLYDFSIAYVVIGDPPLSLGVNQRRTMLPSGAKPMLCQLGELGAPAATAIEMLLLASPKPKLVFAKTR